MFLGEGKEDTWDFLPSAAESTRFLQSFCSGKHKRSDPARVSEKTAVMSPNCAVEQRVGNSHWVLIPIHLHDWQRLGNNYKYISMHNCNNCKYKHFWQVFMVLKIVWLVVVYPEIPLYFCCYCKVQHDDSTVYAINAPLHSCGNLSYRVRSCYP